MRRPLPLLAAPLGLLLATALALTALARSLDQGPVYSVTQLQAHLVADPPAGVGRAVQVRGMAEPCPWWGGAALACGGRLLVLVAADPAATADPLPLERPAPPALLAAARRLPLLDRLLPAPRPLPLYTPLRLRLWIRALPAGACGRLPCYAAQVLDATTS